MNLREDLQKTEFTEPLLREIGALAGEIGRDVKIMEVCGTHTVAIRRFGIHSLLPANVELISGPGCPVCVTPTGYIDNAMSLVEEGRALVATFGDMLKVPGSNGSSLSRHSGSGMVRMVYSPSDLLPLAEESRLPVVFLGVGFETTIPAVAASFLKAHERGMGNLLLYSAFKTIIPALKALLASPDRYIDGFLLPGHVSVILGSDAYKLLEASGGAPSVRESAGGAPSEGVPGAVTGFEPVDILYGLLLLLRQLAKGENRVENAYPRAVRPEGNPRAREIMDRLLESSDDLWRGLGRIPGGGRKIRERYSPLDASVRFQLPEIRDHNPEGCLCGRVILGRAIPTECRLFGRGCTPDQPVGPCMVSSEGTCAAYLRYGGREN